MKSYDEIDHTQLEAQSSPSRIRAFVTFGLFVGVIGAIFLLLSGDSALPPFLREQNCLGAPYLYITLHDAPGNVLKYSRDGCKLSSGVLSITGKAVTPFDVELRSMAFKKHNGENSLIIADASLHNSRLLMFGDCRADGTRPFRRIIVDTIHNRGIDHCYGVCFDSDENIYVSNEHTDSVLRFDGSTFQAMPLPPALVPFQGRAKYFDGTFVQFGQPTEHEEDQQGVRAIAHVRNRIWIAQSDMSGVAIADVHSGMIVNVIPMESPVGLYFVEDYDLMFISCKSKKQGGIIFAVSVDTYDIFFSYEHPELYHPTGMTSYQDILYVAEQETGKILNFNMFTEQYLGEIAQVGQPNMRNHSYIEQLLLSPC